MNFKTVQTCSCCGTKITPFVHHELFITGMIKPACRNCYKEALNRSRHKNQAEA